MSKNKRQLTSAIGRSRLLRGLLTLFLAACTAAPAPAAAIASQRAVNFLYYAEQTGDIDATQRLARLYAARSTTGGEREFFSTLESRLATGDWESIIRSAEDGVADLGFTFTLRTRSDPIVELIKDVIVGLDPKTLPARKKLSSSLAEILPTISIFRKLADRFAKAAEEERIRGNLERQGKNLIAAADEAQLELEKDSLAKNFYEERKQYLRTPGEQSELETRRERVRKDRAQGMKWLNESYAYEPLGTRLKKLVAEVKQRITRGEIKGAN